MLLVVRPPSNGQMLVAEWDTLEQDFNATTYRKFPYVA